MLPGLSKPNESPVIGQLGGVSYSKPSQCLRLLEQLQEDLNVTTYKLGRLLGVPQNSGAHYQWLRGEKRPSQAYCIRMLYLLRMVAFEGLKVNSIDSISWDPFEIHNYKGKGSK